MRNKTLWTAAGVSAVVAAVSTSGSGAGDTLRWLAELCLTGPVKGEMPMIAMEHQRNYSPTLAAGLGLVSAALVTGGLRSGPSGSADALEADPDKILAAMSYVASATGGISPPELSQQVFQATHMELSLEEAELALATYTPEAREDHLAWIGHGETQKARDIIMKAALSIGWTHKEFTPGGLAMIGRLARATELSGDDLALLFWEVTEPPRHERSDPFDKLRPQSRSVSAEPALA